MLLARLLQSLDMNESDSIYADLISTVVSSNNFRTIFYFAPADETESCHMANRRIIGETIPWLIWSSVKSLKLGDFLNANLLVLACLPGIYRQDLLSTIADFLQFIRQTNILIELSTVQDVDLANRVLKFCLQNSMLNAALYFADFEKTRTLFGFDAYPNYALKTQLFGKEFFEIYPDKTIDLKGYPLRTQPDLSEPNTILYYDREGHARFAGYAWNMVEQYSRKHNASLQFSFTPELGKVLNNVQVMDLARKNLIDISASVQPTTLGHYQNYHEFVYPVHINSWCTMMPFQRHMEVREFYAWILPGLTVILLTMLWLGRELLKGRWQRHQRLLGIGWFVLAGLMASNIQGRLLTLFILPPGKGIIQSFAELQDSKTRILIYRNEYNMVNFDLRTKYASAFYLTESVHELIDHRNSLNTSFGYAVSKTKWLLYAEQQSHSSSQLFYYAENLCFYECIPFALVIPDNSPHREPLHRYILQIVESGLYNHWVSKSFYYMVQAGRLHIRDLGETRQSHTLTTQDLRDVLYACAMGLLISLTLFAVELIVYWVKVWLYL